MNDISLRDYIDSRLKSEREHLDSILKLVTQHFDLNEKALKKAEEAMLIRLSQMNEFREQINKERSDYLTKESFSSIEDGIDKRIKALENANSFSAGRMWAVMAGFALIPTILALIALFVR